MKKLLLGILLVLAILAAVVLINTVRFTSRQHEVPPVGKIDIDEDGAALRLSEALRFKTVSHQDPAEFKPREFVGFHKFLELSFPAAHASLRKEVVNGYSLLYTWEGSDPALKPALFLAHIDVVPVTAGTEGDWTHPAFAGHVDEGFIWGRGALDDKGSLMAVLEAVEHLLAQGFQPRRTIILAFGHDEEIGGQSGAVKIAQKLASQGVKAEYVIDEGGAITQGIVPGVDAPVALIGIAEKGYMSVDLVVEAEGGHSSMPPEHTAVGILASAIHNLEACQFPVRMSGPGMKMFEYVGPEMPFFMRMAFANRWLFGPLIERQMTASKSTNASIRTTIAATMIQAGTKENVLPQEARAVVNFRLLPGYSVQDVIDHAEGAIDDPRVKVEIGDHWASEATPITDVDSYGYKTIDRTVREIFPDIIVSPFLVLGGADARHYQQVSDTILRILPVRLDSEDLKRAHGTNERVGYGDHAQSIRFYVQMIRNSN